MTLSESLTIVPSTVVAFIDSLGGNTLIYPDDETRSIVITEDDSQLILSTTSSIQTITIDEVADTNILLDYSASLVGSTVPAITTGYDIGFTTDNDENDLITIADGTSFTGPAGWNGILQLPTITQVSIPTQTSGTTTTTFSETFAFEIGLSSGTIELSTPARIDFTNSGGQGFVAFFVDAAENITFIEAQCTSDSAAGLGGNDECYIEVGDDLIVWTDHFTKFGATKRSSSSTSAPSGGGGTGGGGSTGVSVGYSGFGPIPVTPLAINEVSYDRCTENMARILVSSDAETPPTVKLHTAKSGTIFATLAEVQPYEDLNKLTTVDRYLYEAPISPDESFLMIVVTEEKGTTTHTVQTSVKLIACEGTTVIVELPEDELPEVVEGIPRIFDTKVQIANGTKYDAKSESEFLYLDNQELRVSAIIDSIVPLQEVELRAITMGQSDDQFIGIKMNVEPLFISNSTYLVSASLPSYVMKEPGMNYWLHITDENNNKSESVHYSIGVKPTTISDIRVEMDIQTIRPSGSLIKPELYIFNDDAPSYGIASLVVDGEIVAKKSQLFEKGQTQVIFNWKLPDSDGYSSNDFQGRVDLYDVSVITESAIVSSHPKTISISAYEMKSLEIIEREGQVLADPALIYASNSDADLRFRVIDPQGQCIIGGTEECLVNQSTSGKRGGLESIPYGDQILRVRYSGSDNALERFSITSIDPITGQWNVSLETEDDFIQQAHAMEDTSVKVKYRYHSETITVKSE